MVYNYFAIFAIAFISSAFIPLPAGIILVAASAFASQGYFNIFAVVITAFVACVAGDATGYFVMRHYGKDLFHSLKLGWLIRTKRFVAMERYMLAYPHAVIFFSRFMAEANSIVNYLSGIAKVPVRTFFVLEVAGQALFVALYSGTGYILGSAWEENVGLISRGALFIVSIGIAIGIAQLTLKRFSRSL